MIGDSKKMTKVYQLIEQVAKSNATVLIQGETGTGKELVAQGIHDLSERRDKVIVKVNCAALPVQLCESELFGHERGSFTGALDRRIGKFELANSGTLFLDEIGDMPAEMQVKLLRALQEREIERLGGNRVIKVDVRVIAATNKDLWEEVQEGRFRRDLYYRLNVFPIVLPPVRERKEDIPALVDHFIRRLSVCIGKDVDGVSDRVIHDLLSYDWPGNVRELEHVMERTLLLTRGARIEEVDVPWEREDRMLRRAMAETAGSGQVKTITENERDHILYVLRICRSRINGRGGAAELLGIPPSTLSSKLKRLGIRKEHLA